jgi:hypothetical protein
MSETSTQSPPAAAPQADPPTQATPLDAALDRLEFALLAAGIVRPLRAAVLRQVKEQVLQDIPPSTSPEQMAAALERLGIGENTPKQGAKAGPAPLGHQWRRYLKSLMPRRSRCAFWGAVMIILLLVPLAAIFILTGVLSPHGLQIARACFDLGGLHDPPLFHPEMPEGHIVTALSDATPLARFLWMVAPLTPFALTATLLGAGGLVDILRSRGRLTGLGLALFALLFFPALLAIVALWPAS